MNIEFESKVVILKCKNKVHSKSGCYSCWSCDICKRIGCDNFYYAGPEMKIEIVECENHKKDKQ